MKSLTFLTIFLAVITNYTFSQVYSLNKRDTLYYLVDTTKTLINDRILSIKEGPVFKFYYLRCQCLDDGQIPYFIHKIKEKGDILSLSEVNHIKLINTITLLHLLHENYLQFNNKHEMYFLEVLPDRTIVKRSVKTGALILSSKM